MALSDWLAAIGGGAAAVDQAKTDDENRQLANRRIDAQENAATIRADVMQMIAQLNTGSRERIAGANNDTKRDIAGQGNTTKETIAKLNDVGRTTRAASSEAGRNRRADQTDATQRYGLNLGDSHYWDNSARLYDQLFTTDATRRRGQDMTSATAERGQDMGADTADAGRRARAALGVLGLKQRGQNSLLDDNSTNWADEFDRLYNDPAGAANAAVDASGAPPPTARGPAASPGPTVAPPAAARPGPIAPRPRVPVAPRGGAAAPAAGGTLETQARQLIDQIRAEEARTGQPAAALRTQLAALRAQVH